jgi:hypothetical protein
MLTKSCIDSREVDRAPSHDREGVGESIAVATSGEPFIMAISKEVEIALAVNLKEGLKALIAGWFKGAQRAENCIDAALMLRGGVELAVEKFGGRIVGPLPLVPEKAHRRGLAAAANVKR